MSQATFIGTPPCLVLHNQLVAANIPILGVVDNGNGTYSVQYDPSATALQQTTGAGIVAAFNGKGRIPLPIASIITAFQALTNAQQTQVIATVVARMLQDYPNLLAGTPLASFVGDQASA